jgi:ribosomal protein S24E
LKERSEKNVKAYSDARKMSKDNRLYTLNRNRRRPRRKKIRSLSLSALAR